MPARQTTRSMLMGGDRRSIGRADEVARLVQSQPRRLPGLFECLWDSDPCVSMRAADALEKISRERPDLLQPHKTALLALLAETAQQELRWHLAVMIPRLRLTALESRRAAEILETYLDDRSSIVKTFAMQGLADLARQDSTLLPGATELIRALTRTGTPAMRARGRRLLKDLEKHPAREAL